MIQWFFGLWQPGGPSISSCPFWHRWTLFGVLPAHIQHIDDTVEELVSLIPVHPVTNRTAWLVGEIEGKEAAKGNVLPFNDLMIAAAALEQGYAVLTGNVRHFQKIPGLTVVSL